MARYREFTRPDSWRPDQGPGSSPATTRALPRRIEPPRTEERTAGSGGPDPPLTAPTARGLESRPGSGRRASLRYASAYSGTLDPYRAGVDVAEQLSAVSPGTVLLFCSVNYLDAIPDLVAGLTDVLGGSVLCCGGTGDGVYWAGGVAQHGVAALGVSADQAVRWEAALVSGITARSFRAAQEAAHQALERLGGPPSLGFVMADGCTADGTQLVEGLSQSLPVPFFGALAADDRSFSRTGVFLRDRMATDAVLVLVASGGPSFRISIASGWSPVGAPGLVTRSRGATGIEIEGRPVSDFIAENVGAQLRPSDVGMVPLAIYPPGESSPSGMRAPSHIDASTGEVSLFGSIPEGYRVRVCRATSDEIVEGASAALAGLRDPGFTPGALVVVSCLTRKWLLTRGGAEEIERIRAELGDLPFVGVPSSGEIGPGRDVRGAYTDVLFHNLTFAACLLGR